MLKNSDELRKEPCGTVAFGGQAESIRKAKQLRRWFERCQHVSGLWMNGDRSKIHPYILGMRGDPAMIEIEIGCILPMRIYERKAQVIV